MKIRKTKKITSASLRGNTRNKSRVLRRNNRKKNTFMDYIRMIFF